MTDDGPRWAGRIMLAVYIVGLVSAMIMMIKLVVQKVWTWLREKGGW